ncbi:MAG: hypothetical protein MAG551_00716 [Candidatus Scalindua arabica]|uniref:Uncharacterized protein n=1 Tax=Candidatus Scalindua arabica TaxID=1127984 RepID=A0A942A1A9_9BACT|nr:hypothetical protein [Candidatus Scalindua arabica]
MRNKYLFDNPRNVKILLMLLFVGCLALVIINFFVHIHGHFSWEEWSGFYAVYGFVTCVGLVLAAKFILRKIVKRSEDYYD